jgi:UDP-glucose 4-epimerase
MNILLTGGVCFIGSHTYIALGEAGYTSVILDIFYDSDLAVLDPHSVLSQTGQDCNARIERCSVSVRAAPRSAVRTY